MIRNAIRRASGNDTTVTPVVSQRTGERRAEQRADHDADDCAKQCDHDRFGGDHAYDLAASHADCAQQPDLTRALEDRQHQVLDDPDQRHQNSQCEQHVDQVEQRVDVVLLVLLNWARVRILRLG